MESGDIGTLPGSGSFRALAESEHYIVGHEFETAYLVEKATGVKTYLDDHYGDPTCAVIAPGEDWFAVGGVGITYFDFARGVRKFKQSSSQCVHAMRANGPDRLRVLLDPWSECASVWELHTKSLSLRKLTDGPFLADEPYREVVEF